MNRKNYYQKPTLKVVSIKHQNLLEGTQGGLDGPGEARQQRPDWDED